MATIDEVTTKLKIAEETLHRETKRMEQERIEMERIMGQAQEQINGLKADYANLEERMMVKVGLLFPHSFLRLKLVAAVLKKILPIVRVP